MNILDHILAGHYPKDDKGRALVPSRHGGTVVICATDMPGSCPILGFRIDDTGSRVGAENADHGFGYWPDTTGLLPPTPRKVKVTAWARVAANNDIRMLVRDRNSLFREPEEYCSDHVVELTGEYEQPWEA